MKLNEISEEIQGVWPFLRREVDINNGSEIAEKGQKLTVILPRLHFLSAELESIISVMTKNFIDENGLMNKPYTDQTRSIAIEDQLSEIIKLHNTAKGYIKSIEETLDFYRTLLSYLKQEMSNLNIGK